MPTYFHNVTTLDELKQQYRKLSLKLHPDRSGGNEKEFIKMKDEYDRLFKRLKNRSTNTEKEQQAFDESEEYADIIAALMKYNLDIEIIGSWIWIAGNTYKIKDEIKELGFKWSKNKKMWFWMPEDYVRKSRKTFHIDEIRNMHGSQQVKKADKTKEPKKPKPELITE